jgi:hypothetical protein
MLDQRHIWIAMSSDPLGNPLLLSALGLLDQAALDGLAYDRLE